MLKNALATPNSSNRSSQYCTIFLAASVASNEQHSKYAMCLDLPMSLMPIASYLQLSSPDDSRAGMEHALT